MSVSSSHFFRKAWVIVLLMNISCRQEEDASVVKDGATFIEYEEGNIPLILTVAHGGSEKPDWMGDRTCPDAVSVQDEFTLELTDEILSAFAAAGTYRPFVIRNTLHRGKLDPNRNRIDGACGDPNAQKAYDAFHGFTTTAKTIVTQRFSKGILIDIHGHGHEIQRVELGYLLYEEELQESDDAINQPPLLTYSSIQSLVADNLNNYTHSELLRGPFAFGSLLHSRGFACVPSQAIPFPQPNEPYFSGGYITATHGSYRGGTIDAIQMECNLEQVRDTAKNRKAFAEAFVSSTLAFLQTHYFEAIPQKDR
jgi:N-formylglutamate amidohydrolase